VSRILITAALLLTATSAWGQGYFGGSDGGMGRYHGVMPNPGPYRAINHDPATGRTYAREADYLTPKQHSRQGAENKTMTTLLLALILAAIVVCCPLLRRAVFAAVLVAGILIVVAVARAEPAFVFDPTVPTCRGWWVLPDPLPAPRPPPQRPLRTPE
jgi:hypothetical protein